MTGAKQHLPGAATYRGDVVAATIGRVMGPTTYGAIVIADSAIYDPGTDRTRVRFVHATPDQVEELRQLGWRGVGLGGAR